MSEDGKNFAEKKAETEGTVYKNMFELDTYLQGKTKPDGGAIFPGKTCKDLQLCHKDIKSSRFNHF